MGCVFVQFFQQLFSLVKQKHCHVCVHCHCRAACRFVGAQQLTLSHICATGDDFEACGLHVFVFLFHLSAFHLSSIRYHTIAVKFPKSNVVPYLICCFRGTLAGCELCVSVNFWRTPKYCMCHSPSRAAPPACYVLPWCSEPLLYCTVLYTDEFQIPQSPCSEPTNTPRTWHLQHRDLIF